MNATTGSLPLQYLSSASGLESGVYERIFTLVVARYKVKGSLQDLPHILGLFEVNIPGQCKEVGPEFLDLFWT